MSSQNLKGSVALISGGLGDIGRASALELAKQGADVAIGDMQTDTDFQDFKRDCEALGVHSHYTQIDVTDAHAVERWVETVQNEMGTPNLIIVNAGIVEMADFKTITPAIWKRQLDVNLNGAFYMSHYASQNLLVQNKAGRIVFVGSWAAHTPHTHIPAYCVSKAGLRSLCQNLALELAPNEILVNEVAPGTVNAGLSAELFKKDTELAAKQSACIPNRRMLEAIDVAREIVHLCDPDIVHHVGSTLLIDGGNTLRGPAS